MHSPRKRFGQNFLHDPDAIAQIVRLVAPRAGEHLVEIGPGRAALTSPLLEHSIDLDVVEIDRDLITRLANLATPAGSALCVHNADALEFEFCTVARDDRKLRVIGNLPYNISTPLLFHLVEQIACIQDMHFMLQKEVVDRMAASAGEPDYSRLSIMIQFHCMVQPLFTLGPGSFHPAPKVESSFVRLTPHARPPVAIASYDLFALTVKTAFAYRRKTLRNALQGLLSPPMFEAAGIDPGLRAEQLDLPAFAQLSNQLASTRDISV